MANKLPFLKMSGAGNDFVIFDFRSPEFAEFQLSQSLIKAISSRQNIGCDQLIVVRKPEIESFSTNQPIPQIECEMQIFNADSSEVAACGNATRCVARILLGEKFSASPANFDLKQKIFIKTKAGLLSACYSAENEISANNPPLNPKISVNMGSAKIINQNLEFFGYRFCHIDIGNPHAVAIISENLSNERFFEISPQIEKHSSFPNKTNVEFAKIISGNLIEVRVWERGVGETLACGSGACAVGFYALQNSLIDGSRALIRFKGGDLEISRDIKNPTEIIMTGDAKMLFCGEIAQEFLQNFC